MSERDPVESDTPTLLRHSFRSMGTTIRLIAPAGTAFARAATEVERIFTREDRRLSRFRPDSELSFVNAAAGRRTAVSRPFAEVLAIALEGAEETGGLFDPTVLPSLLAAGYDRDFAELADRPIVPQAPPPVGGRWRDVEVELATPKVDLPHGVALDFGGVGKGWTVDRAVEAASRALPWALVDGGGDLRVHGDVPAGGLETAVENPFSPGDELLRLRLERGALATSSVLSRRWGEGLHQLIDPRTSRPARTDVVQATAWAPTCAEAEIRATHALLVGLPALDRFPAVLVMQGGSLVLNVSPDGPVGEAAPMGVPA